MRESFEAAVEEATGPPARTAWPACWSGSRWCRCSPPTRPRPGAGPWSTPCAGWPSSWPAWTPPGCPGDDEATATRRLEEITGLWRTAQLRRDRPTPLDEVRSVMAVFDATLFRLVPATYRALEQALTGRRAGPAPPFGAYLRWGSWVGGDRDGNPSVTAETTRAAMAIQADHVLRGLEAVTCGGTATP